LYPSNTVPTDADYPSVTFTAKKRIVPTVTVYSYHGAAGRISTQFGVDLAASSAMAVAFGEGGFTFRNQSGAALTLTTNTVLFHYAADARL
jgi:hypothetical protein